MAKRSMRKGIIKDIIIVGIGIVVIAISLQIVFGTANPFYVVASGSMIPVLQVYDVLIVQGDCFDWTLGLLDPGNCSTFSWHTPFENIEVGDIIVFNRPSDHNRVIVHRVASILDDDPKTIRTQGDANPSSIPGTDFPITEEEYIGEVVYTIPQAGYVTQLLKPPVNYVIIAIVIGVMIIKQMIKKKDEKELTFEDPLDSDNPDTIEELSGIDKIKKDSEYSEHIEESDILEEEQAESVEETKKDEKDEKK